MTEKKTDVIVIGGGYFGLSSAYHLAKSGLSTRLLERREIASGASGANFGCVQVQDSEPGLSLVMTLDGFKRMQHMEEELGSKINYRSCPSLIAAEKKEHLGELERLYREKREAGLDVRWLEGKALIDAEPNLAEGSVLAASYFMQGQIYPFDYLYALDKKAKVYGLICEEEAEVVSIDRKGGAVAGVTLADGSTRMADVVVLAAGSWTKALAKTAGLDVRVESVKAETLITEAVKPVLKTYYSSAGFFAEAHGSKDAATSLCISQSHHGNILAGETTKPHNIVSETHQDRTSREHLSSMRKEIEKIFPVFSTLNVLRSIVVPSPATSNQLPYLGPSPVDGLYLCAGFKSAVVMSPVAGKAIADLIRTGKADYDLSSFSVAAHDRADSVTKST